MILYSGKKFTFEIFLNAGKTFGSIAFPLSLNYWHDRHSFKRDVDDSIVKCTSFDVTLYFLCFGISLEYWGEKE